MGAGGRRAVRASGTGSERAVEPDRIGSGRSRRGEAAGAGAGTASSAEPAGAEAAGVPTRASVSETGWAAAGAGAATTGIATAGWEAAFWRTATYAPPAAAVTQPATSSAERRLELMISPEDQQKSNCCAPHIGAGTSGIQQKRPESGRLVPLGEPGRGHCLSYGKDPQRPPTGPALCLQDRPSGIMVAPKSRLSHRRCPCGGWFMRS
jgi:hypothetical protein